MNLKYLLLFCSLNILLLTNAQEGLDDMFDSFWTSDDFDAYDTLFENKTVIFTGEDHRFRDFNQKLEYKLFKYLNENHGFNRFMVEFGPSVGWLLNEYIDPSTYESMTEEREKEIKETIELYSYSEFVSLFTKLRKLNKDLPAEQRFKVLPTDVDKTLRIPLRMLDFVLPQDKEPRHDSVSLTIELIQIVSDYLDSQQESYVTEEDKSQELNVNSKYSMFRQKEGWYTAIPKIITNYKKYTKEFKQYLEEDFDDFKHLMEALIMAYDYNQKEYESELEAIIFRERQMVNNITEALENSPNAKFYGQFGRCHTYFESKDNEECYPDFDFAQLAYRLQHHQNEKLNGKVLSLPIFYINSMSDAELIKMSPEDVPEDKKAAILVNEDEMVNVPFPVILISNEEANFVNPFMEYLNTALSLPWIQWHVHGGFGVRTRWNTDYNDYMAMNGRPGIANYALMWEAGITYNEPGWTYASLTYQMSLTETVQNANFRVNLSEFQIMGRGGFSFIPSDWVSFIAYGGLGYGQYTLKEEDLNSPILGNDLFQNEYETTTYTNPAFMLDLGIDFKATLAFFSIGINGGYMFDVSKQGWKQDGVYIDSSAPLSLGGFYGFATASFYLPY